MTALSHTAVVNGQAMPVAETVAVTSPVNAVQPGISTKVVIKGVISFTTGAGTTAVVGKVYRGAVVSAPNLIGTFTTQIGAALPGEISIDSEDTVAWLSVPANGGQYCVSLTETAGTGAGTLTNGGVGVDVLP